jgi:Gpi18-like mannosyltransferase
MLSRKTAWLDAAWIFVLSRLVILFVTFIADLRIPPVSLDNFWFSWMHWDVFSYIGVAQNGYSLVEDTVFFPLWPLLIHGTGAVFGASPTAYYIAGFLLANLFFYLALVMFYHVLNKDFDSTVARNALFYLTFSPYAIFFFLGYTESLSLFLYLAAFLCLQHARYWLAGLCGFLAALTHSQGVLLVIPFAIVMLQRFWLPNREHSYWWQKLHVSFPLLLIPLGVLVFMLYLWMTKGSPLLFSLQEAQFWHRHLTFPLWSMVLAIQAIFHAPNTYFQFMNVLDLLCVCVPLVILVTGWKRLPLQYALFALATILLNISYPQGVLEPLTAVPRYMLLVFPVFVILGAWGKNPRLDRVITVCLFALFVLNILLFVKHSWIA